MKPPSAPKPPGPVRAKAQGAPTDAAKSAVLLIVAFLLLLADKIVYWLPRDLLSDGIDPWVLSGWIIDYSSGFVRRGASGELIGALTLLIPPKQAIALLIWSAFLVTTAGYLRLVLRARPYLSTLALLGLLFLPSLLPFYLYDHLAFGRKEVVGFILVLWHLMILERCCPRDGPSDARGYLLRASPLAMLGLPLLALMHEATALWFGPTHALLTLLVLHRGAGWRWRRSLSMTTALYLPLAVVLLAIVLFGRGTPEIAQGICRHWVALGLLPSAACTDAAGAGMPALAPAIDALGWSLSKGIAIAAAALPPKAIVLWLTVLPILGLATLAVGGMASRSIAEGRPSEGLFNWLSRPGAAIALLFFLLPLLLPAPLYLIAHDYGRWFAIACINYAMLSLSPEVIALVGGGRVMPTAPAPTGRAGSRDWLRFTAKATFLLFCIMALRLPHCCAAFHMLAPSLRTVIENAVTLAPSRPLDQSLSN